MGYLPKRIASEAVHGKRPIVQTASMFQLVLLDLTAREPCFPVVSRKLI